MRSPIRFLISTIQIFIFVFALKALVDLLPGAKSALQRATYWALGPFQSFWVIRENWARDNSFESALISLVPYYLISIFSAIVRSVSSHLYSNFIDAPIDVLARSSSVLHLVFPRMDGIAFTHVGNPARRTKLPPNVSLLPYGDALAGMLIIDFLKDRYRGKIRVVTHYGGDAQINTDENIICIGGPDVNAMTNRLIRTKAIRRFDPYQDGIICLGNKSYSAKHDGDSHEQRVCQDYGVALGVSLKKTGRQRIVVIFGIWPFGTYAAAELLTGAIGPGKLVRRFAQSLKRRRDVLSLVEAKDVGRSDFHADVMSTNELKIAPD